MRVLIGIASFGEKNLPFLRRIIARYQEMRFATKIVVFSEAPKDLDDCVEVAVGLPTENPWSLPFAHRAYFAARVDDYDLFIYSEDDMEVTEANIDAFIALQGELKDDEIAGFIRYERLDNDTITLPDFRDHFHWNIESVRKRGAWTLAEFTNAHSAFYVLTRAQLKRAIESGGYRMDPHEGEYDMLCSAATDPYTSCGLTRLICISKLKDFLILHAPNRYAGKIGLPLHLAELQIKRLLEIGSGTHTPRRLLPASMTRAANKSYYEKLPSEAVTVLRGGSVRRVLSVGCGSGETEAHLAKQGCGVTALPLDSVIGAIPEAAGVDVLPGTLNEGLNAVSDRVFDTILINNLLHLLPDPSAFFEQCAEMLTPDGRIVVVFRNADYLPRRLARGAQGGHSPHLRIQTILSLARRCGLVANGAIWHGYRDETALSGALHPRKGLRGLAQGLWHSVRQGSRTVDAALHRVGAARGWTGLSVNCSTGRWLATDCVVTLVRDASARTVRDHRAGA